MILITKHAERRANERFGWNAQQLHDQAHRSLEHGVIIVEDDFLMDLFRRTIQYNPNSVLYFHDGIVFVFDDERLVTLYPINGRYSK